ncbi:MAG: membrane protein insertase YidC [Candidatus Aminicenantales bacterium]
MERRLILAIVLSFALLGLYWIFFLNKPVPAGSTSQTRPPVTTPSQAPPPVVPVPVEKSGRQTPAKPAVTPAHSGQAVSAANEQPVKVVTPLYSAEWSTRGAVLRSWTLTDIGKNNKYKYMDEAGNPLQLVNIEPAELKASNRYPFYLDAGDQTINEKINNNKTEFYKASATSLSINEGKKAELAFVYDDGAGLRVEKKFLFNGNGYDFGVSISLKVKGEEKPYRLLWGPSIGPASQAVQRQRVGSNTGFVVFSGGKDYRLDDRQFKPNKWATPDPKDGSLLNFNGLVSWAAFEETYFAALFLVPSSQGTAVFQREMVNNFPFYYLLVTGAQSAYLGPKELDRLKALDPQFGSTKKLVQFGFFGVIVEVLLIVIRAIYKVIPNWGLAIIILTILIKILFFPLTYSSTKSMARMQELQPKIKALRAKYKKSKTDIAQRRQMNEEMMKLYKEHGVNPAGGCLPMLIQLPVFWAIWRLLSVSIELRQSPFVFWIKDLSVKDPYLVTPILMGITQYISQKMTPTGADPSQARMMLIMPVIMTFFFLGFPSGLVLYWLSSNVLQIVQQHFMNRMQAKRRANEDRRKK